jgi:Bcr/CflA subfamily drug resistance transporter
MNFIPSIKQKKHILALIFLIPLLMGMSIDLYVPSLPAIGRYFHAPEHSVKLTVGLYVLGYAIAQFFLGILSDSLGRKKILVLGGFLYTLISFLAAFSINIQMLILCRALQGCAIAGAGVVIRAIVADCFTDIHRTRAMTYISTSWAIGPIIGPFIGGYLQSFFNWQASFCFFGLYGLCVFIYAALFLTETHFELAPLHFRKMGKTILQVILHSAFIRYSLIASLIYAILVVFNVIAPFFVQDILHYSAVGYGHIAFLLGFGYFLGSLTNLWIIHRFNVRKIAFFGLSAALGMALIFLLAGTLFPPNLYSLMGPVFFLFLFCGLVFPNVMAMNASLFPMSAGTSSAIFGSWVSGGVSLVAMMGSLLGTETQTPLALLYLGMCVICFVLFYFAKK